MTATCCSHGLARLSACCGQAVGARLTNTFLRLHQRGFLSGSTTFAFIVICPTSAILRPAKQQRWGLSSAITSLTRKSLNRNHPFSVQRTRHLHHTKNKTRDTKKKHV